MELTDLATIRTLCEKYDFALSKGFGQNFIVNPGVPPKIVDAAGIDRSFGVLEIGPGIGVLTKEIAKRAGKVVAIEVDKRLPPVLEETLAGFDNANLPYYITSPIIMKLLEDRLPIQNITVMVQKEAAERLAALPGTRASGAVSCAVRYFAQPKMMFTVQAGSFYPAPKVTSAVVRLDIRPTPAVAVPDEKAYFALVRAAFGQRRKTAANAIAAGLGLPRQQVADALAAAGLDPRVRPEQLTLEHFAALDAALRAAGPSAG